jgi:DNA-binding NarL/FixJ family response regulator
MLSLSKGTPLKRIASSLGLSVKTVSTFRARALAKLDLHSNADLIRYVLEHKLG